ncbi:MAG: hypothetical protein QOI55_2065 [Actinomycetota bacterium]|nr:hypothetical protein [Actinomycetota bacterium]
MRLRPELAATVLLVAVLNGCDRGASTSDSVAETRIAGIPVLRNATSPAGTALGNGLRVPPASVLVGSVVPLENADSSRGRPDSERGWQAWMLVTGDPRVALRSLSAQAHAIGIELNGTQCAPPSSTAVGCRFDGERKANGRTRWIDVTVQRGLASPHNQSFSQIVVEFHDVPSDGAPHVLASHAVVPAFPRLPRRWPDLGAPGDVLMPTSKKVNLKVEEGSHQAAPLFAGPGTVSAGSVTAILAVDGEPKEVITAYSRQVADLADDGRDGADSTRVSERHDDGARVLEFTQESVDGYYFGHLVSRRGQQSWLVIERLQHS